MIFNLICRLLGLNPIDGICKFSKKIFDIHDYTKDRGGDGTPTHFHTYICWNCGKKFTI